MFAGNEASKPGNQWFPVWGFFKELQLQSERSQEGLQDEKSPNSKQVLWSRPHKSSLRQIWAVSSQGESEREQMFSQNQIQMWSTFGGKLWVKTKSKSRQLLGRVQVKTKSNCGFKKESKYSSFEFRTSPVVDKFCVESMFKCGWPRVRTKSECCQALSPNGVKFWIKTDFNYVRLGDMA